MNFIFIIFLFHFISSNTILKIGLSNSSIYFQDICSIYEIKTNYKHISLKISNFTNINYIQITDKIIQNSCNPHKCSNESVFCTSKKFRFKYLDKKVIKESITQFDTKICTNALFLSLEKENYNINSSFTISISILPEENNEDCTYHSQNSFTFCGNANLKDCKYCRVESCSIVQCGKEIINETGREDQFVYLYNNNFLEFYCRNVSSI